MKECLFRIFHNPYTADIIHTCHVSVGFTIFSWSKTVVRKPIRCPGLFRILKFLRVDNTQRSQETRCKRELRRNIARIKDRNWDERNRDAG